MCKRVAPHRSDDESGSGSEGNGSTMWSLVEVHSKSWLLSCSLLQYGLNPMDFGDELSPRGCLLSLRR